MGEYLLGSLKMIILMKPNVNIAHNVENYILQTKLMSTT